MSLKSKLRKLIKRKGLGGDIWYFLHLCNINLKRILSDEVYFQKVYQNVHGERANFSDPRTFDEKQLWLKMYYRNPLCVTCSDKYLVREYVKELGLDYILNPLYGVYDSVSEIDWDSLPERFYLKANHMSGCNICCIDPRTFNRKEAIHRLNRGMHHDYSLDSREWCYGPIKRKIIAEAIIEDKQKNPLVDYRFLCSSGRCEYVFIDIGTAAEDGRHLEDARRNVYDREMNLLDVKVTRENFPAKLVKKPVNFEEMVKIAEKLSGCFPFCRVDLYNVDERIIFGEMTFFHSGGLSIITPKMWEIKLGDSISIENAKWQIDHNYHDINS